MQSAAVRRPDVQARLLFLLQCGRLKDPKPTLVMSRARLRVIHIHNCAKSFRMQKAFACRS